MFKKIIIGLLCCVTLLSGCSSVGKSNEEQQKSSYGSSVQFQEGSSDSQTSFGEGSQILEESSGKNEEITLPSAYDLRDEKQVTPARDQKPYGTCWAFSGMSSAETALLKQGITDQDYLSLDLSEEALLWWACGDCLNHGNGWQKKSKDDGGFLNMVCGFLASNGVYNEKDLPYDTDKNEDAMGYYLPEEYPKELDSLSPIYRALDIVYVDTSDRDAVKSAVMNCGSVATGWYDSGEYRDDIPAYWNAVEHESNHSISIVGWDDDYPSENFQEVDGVKPESNGAWLIKNSYGTDFGDDGFMWISYEDKDLFVPNSKSFEIPTYAVKRFIAITDDMYFFEHDYYGAVTDISKENALWANVYDFSLGKKYINAVTFETQNGKDQTYSVYYAPVSDDGVPDADISKMTLLKTGTVDHNGYNTVYLDKSFEVPRKKGAIVIDIGGSSSVGVQVTLIDRGRGVFLPGETNKKSSFIINDGKPTDLFDQHTTVSIKVLTQDEPV